MKKESFFSKRLQDVSYAIREFVPIAKEVEKTKKVVYLNIGDPLKYDFKTPDYIKEALVKAVRNDKNFYADSQGVLELREAIAERENKNNVSITPDDVLVTMGISEGIMAVFASLLNPGDEVLLPGPAYPLYIDASKFFGAKFITYKCDENLGWQPDIEDLQAKVSEKTKLIVVINPNNPTGSLYEKSTLKKIVDIAAQFDVPIVSDEIYDQIVYEGETTPLASISDDVTVIGLNGFSKLHLVTGWRMGYIYIKSPDEELKNQIYQTILKYLMFRLSAHTPSQFALAEVLRGEQKHVEELVKKLKERRDYVYRRIEEIDGLSAVLPKGAFYIFPKIETKGAWKDDKEFSLKLLKEMGVFVVYGSGFDPTYGKDHFRMVFLPPVEMLEEAMDRIEKFLKKHSG
ncbi:MAG: aminotransferase class I/II-fold pyridoxal phosphate-dependent enzyme [Candidatus Aenigmarchaeota archaeon]|nr:aminotransferase class I/II-fold pyridoxal phosphate-dependent enzyme [Candidatus Aenigmarchaeota archaeon]